MDTANDYRVLLAERGIEELKRISGSIGLPRKYQASIQLLASDLQNVKYCYLDYPEICEFESLKKLTSLASEIRANIRSSGFAAKLANYWLEYIENLPQLFARGEIEKIHEAVRFFSCRIVSRRELDSLWLCVAESNRRFEVVTNSEELAKKENVVVSYLPPRRFGDVISEGMFVDASFSKLGELSLDEIRGISDKLGEVDSVLISILG